MASRTAKFISTIFASVIAGAPLATMSPGAADDCLPGPNGASPQGQHWFYRLEKETKRKCWYLRGGGEKAVKPHTRVAAEPAPKPEAAHSVEDAHAELTAPPPLAGPPIKATIAPPPPPPARMAPAPAAAAQVFPASADNTEQQASAPETESVNPPPSVSVSSPSGDARRKKLLSTSLLAASAAAEPASQKPAGSLQTLLLVMVGALGLAGLVASLIYRSGGITRLRFNANHAEPRRINWDATVEAGGTPWRDHMPPTSSTLQGPPSWDENADQGGVISEPEQDLTDPAASAHSELDVDEITDMLERLVRQGPQLDAPSAGAGFADRGRNRLDRPAVRA